MQTILGANGTIGSVLAKELRSYTDKIRLVSRNPEVVFCLSLYLEALAKVDALY